MDQSTSEARKRLRAERYSAAYAARTPEQRAKTAAKVKATRAARTPEQREALRLKNQARSKAWRDSQTPEERQRIADKAKATKAAKSPGEKAAISAKLKARWQEWTPEQRAARLAPSHAIGTPAMHAARRGKKRSPEENAKHRATLAARFADPVWAANRRSQMAEKARRQWEGKSHEERIALTDKMRRIGRGNKETQLERVVAAVLEAFGISYEKQYVIQGYRADLYIPERNLIIECDGRYWHAMPGRAEYDENRDARIRECGYGLVRLSEAAIAADPVAAVTTALKGV